jgi:exodeoxyribonuclease-1
MAAFSFYWHDYETFGANPSIDRPSQFAGIRTDSELNIIAEPLEVFCQPAPDFLPQPMACLITGITPQHALANGVNEAEFMAIVHKELAAPGTCGVGYNSIRFDDEVTRYGLYRNFYEPYGREWQNGNSRWDLIDVVRLCYALRPEGINWPLREDGSPSFKLELLTQANGIEQVGAHDALVDVRATIELAKLIKNTNPKLFDYALSLRKKAEVSKCLDVAARKPVLHVSSKFLAINGCAALVVPIAIHPRNSNGVIVIDLAQNPDEWVHLTADEIRKKLYTPSAEMAEGENRVGIKTIHINKSPMLVTAKALEEKRAAELGVDLAECRKNYLRWKNIDPSVIEKIREVLDTEPPERGDVDSMLYSQFLPNSDKNLLQQVRMSTPNDLAGGKLPFTDERLPDLLFRYRARNWPESLSAEETGFWAEFCHQRIHDVGGGGSIVMTDYLVELAELKTKDDLSDKDRNVLDALEEYAKQF